MRIPFLFTIVTTLFLSACGGGSGGGEPESGTNVTFDPWKGIGEASLSETETTERVRVLEFDDGMAISYDGSDEEGEERMCRREDREGVFYEVCVSLEDDPYFVALESNSLVWHPLLFERFTTDITCHTWTEGEEKLWVDCDSVAFPEMGGEDFRCEAGVVNGDKALKCSDDWAVVVNGGEHDTKSVCRVHLTHGSGRCLGARKGKEKDDKKLIRRMQRTFWDGYRSTHGNARQFREGDVVEPQVPQNLPEGAKLSYTSFDTDVCRVNNSMHSETFGTLTIAMAVAAPAVCKISLVVRAEGFVDRVLTARLAVLKPSEVTWATYYRRGNYFYVGETLKAKVPVFVEPARMQSEFVSLDESVCTVDKNTGAVTGVAAGECTVRLLAVQRGYLDSIVEHSFEVSASTPFAADIVWSDFDALDAATVLVGTIQTLTAPTATDGGGNTVAIRSIEYVSGGCQYALRGSDHNISFEKMDECVLRVTVVGGRGTTPATQDFRFTPGMGTFTLTWAGYTGGNALTYGAEAPGAEAVTIDPTNVNADLTYTASGGACEVDAKTGALTIVGATEGGSLTCVVTLGATGSGYADATPVPVTVTIAKADQSPSVSNLYGGVRALEVSGTLTVLNPPTGGMGTLTWSIKEGGTNCTIDQDGTLTGAGSAETCTVLLNWAGDDNHNAAAQVEIPIAIVASGAGSANVDPIWSKTPAPYANNPTVGGVESQVAGAITNASAGTGTLQYQSTVPDICTVAADGAVTGVSVGTCTIQVRFAGDNAKVPSAWVDSPAITVDKGTHPALEDISYYDMSVVRVGKSLELGTTPEGFGVAMYSVKTGSESFCSVDEGTGAVTGVAVGECIVQVAFAGDDNYNALAAADLQTIRILGANFRLRWNPYRDGVEYRKGSEGKIGEVDDGGLGAEVEYAVVDAGSTGCAFKGNSGDDRLILTFGGYGVCRLKATASVPNYKDWVGERSLRVRPGAISVDVNGFIRGRALKVGSDSRTPVAYANLNPPYAEALWQLSRGERDCILVDGATGEVAARTVPIADPSSPPVCSLRLTASAPGYDNFRSEAVEIPLARGDLSLIAVDTGRPTRVRPPAFGEGISNNLPLNIGEGAGYLDVNNSSNHPRIVPISLDVAGTDGDGTTKANVCTVDNDRNSPTFGRVSVGSGAASGDKCTVTTTMGAVGYTPVATTPVVLTIVTEALEFGTTENPTTPALGFHGRLKVGTQSVSYREGLRQASTTSAVPTDVCELDSETGLVTGLKKGNCQVNLSIPDAPTGIKVVLSNTASIDSITTPGICSVDKDTGRIIAKELGMCTVAVRFLTNTHTATVTGNAMGNVTVTPPTHCTYNNGSVANTYSNGDWDDINGKRVWSPGGGICYLHFPIRKKPVEVELKPSNSETAFTVITPAESSPGNSNPAQVCTLDRATGIVRGVDVGTCEVIFGTDESETVTLARKGANYVDTTGLPDEYVPLVNGTAGTPQPITWHYRNPRQTAGGEQDPCIVLFSYEDNKDVRLQTHYTAKPGDTCALTAVGVVEGYGEYRTGELIVPLISGELVFEENSPNTKLYDGVLRLGRAEKPSYSPTYGYAVDDNFPPVPVRWQKWRTVGYAAGTDFEEKDGVCSVNSQGVVRTGSAAEIGDICHVFAQAGPDKTNHKRTWEIRVGAMRIKGFSEFGTVVVPEKMYSEDLSLRGNPIDVGTPPFLEQGEIQWIPGRMSFATNESPQNLQPVVGADESDVTYTVASAGTTGCRLTGNQLSFTGVGICKIQATANRASYPDWESPEFDIEISDDPLLTLAWEGYASRSSFDPMSGLVGTKARVRVGDSLTPTQIRGAGARAAVAIKEFGDYDFTGNWNPQDNCEVNPNTGEVTGLRRGDCPLRLVFLDSPTQVTVVPNGTTVTTHTRNVCSKNGNTITGNGRGTCHAIVNFPSSPTRVTFARGDDSISLFDSTPSICTLNPQNGLVVGRSGSETCQVGVKFTASVEIQESGSGVAYGVSTPNVCTFNPVTGVVTGHREGETCTMTLRFSDTTSTATLTDPGGQMSFAATPAETCSISNAGVVTPVATGDCTVSFTVAMASKTVTLTTDSGLDLSTVSVPAASEQTICTYNNGTITGSKAGSCMVSFTVDAGVTVATFSPEGPFVSASVEPEEVCSVGADGVVTGESTGVCYVTLEVSKPGRASYQQVAPVIVEPEDEVVWRYRSEGKRGGVVTQGICSVDEETGAVTPGASAQAGDECEIITRVEAQMHNPKELDAVVLTLKEVFAGFTWSDFPSRGSVGESIDFSGKLPVFDPMAESSDIRVISGDCTYTGTTLAFTGTTNCVVEVTASKEGYADFREELVVNLAQLEFARVGKPHGDSSTLVLASHRDAGVIPAADDNGNPLSWSFSVAGTRSGSTQAGVCSVDNTPNSPTFGRVTSGASAQLNDVCTVTITASTTADYADYTQDIALTLRHPHPLQLKGGRNNYCVLFEGGGVKCWGDNFRGQAGIGDTAGDNARIGDQANEMGSNLAYVSFDTGRTAVEISVGAGYVCAILDNGKLVCWGYGTEGRLGYGDTNGKNAPGTTYVNLGGKARQVATGDSHTCAILLDDTLKCWGDNTFGQIGDGTSGTNRLSPLTVNLGSNMRPIQVVAGGNHTCAIVEDTTNYNRTVKCWGDNNDGQVGAGTTTTTYTSPVAVTGLGSDGVVVGLSLGNEHTCANFDNGDLKCWGENGEGQIGNRNLNDQTSPVTIFSGNSNVQKVATGWNHTCAVLDSNFKCWGHNNKGQVGVGRTNNIKRPANVDIGSNLSVVEVALTEVSSCALLSDRTVKCWGEHAYGSFGGRCGYDCMGRRCR